MSGKSWSFVCRGVVFGRWRRQPLEIPDKVWPFCRNVTEKPKVQFFVRESLSIVRLISLMVMAFVVPGASISRLP